MTNPFTALLKSFRHHDRPFSLVYLIISFIGCAFTIVCVYGFYLGHRLSSLDESLVDAAMEIKLEATSGMLLFEDILNQNNFDPNLNIWQRVDHVLWYMRRGLERKGLIGKDISGRNAEIIKVHIKRIDRKLIVLKKIT